MSRGEAGEAARGGEAVAPDREAPERGREAPERGREPPERAAPERGAPARGAATRAALLGAARELFIERGYAGVGTEEIVARAGVTRGALYHHFIDKRDLFRAVHEELEGELVAGIGERMGGVADPWELMLAGLRAFLDACTDPAIMRVALLDAPAVLGWQEWRRISERHGMGLVSFGLQNAMDAGVLARRPVAPLAHLLMGAMSEAAMVIVNADDPAAAREEIEPPLVALLDGLRQHD
jgi:AcrR family transcriptional regulator